MSISTIEEVRTKVAGLSLLIDGLLYRIQNTGTPTGDALDNASMVIDGIFREITNTLDSYL